MLSAMRTATRSLSARLVMTFVAVIVATTVVAGVPAYWLVRTQLEQQAWARVANGGRVTLALLETEQVRLSNLVELTAQRPTLQGLLQEGDSDALSDYLQTFQSSVELDILVVRDATGQLVADGAPSSPWPDPPFATGVAFHSVPGPEPELAILASQVVLDNRTGQLLGFVTAGFLLDDDFARQLAAKTGFGQSIVVEGKRIATSLPAGSPTVDSEVAERAAISGEPETTAMGLQKARYYAVLLPLSDAQGELVALAEVALPVDEQVAAEHRALATLVLSTLLVAVAVSALSVLLARQLTAPLRQLTVAASKISQGDLATPVPLPREPIEVATLAATLEESRVNIRRTLDDLSQAKAWSETLIQSVVEGVVTFDEHGRITFFNKGAERITGWLSDEALGKPLNRVFRLSDDETGQFMEHIPPYGIMRQVNVLTRTGRPATLAVTGPRPIPSDDDGDEQIALVLRDITEEEASRNLRSYFLANVSHEFRTPLSAINASVELLLEEAEHRPLTEMRELLTSIHLSVVGLQTLIDNLLESTSIEAGRFRIHHRLTVLDDVIDQAIQVMQPLLNRRQQSLALAKPAELPMVDVDPTRLTQVLVNLLSNASKYSPLGKEIGLSLELAGDSLRVAVADQGPGIPPAERDNLFRRFVRLSSQDEAQYGVGLGLSVVKAIVEGHGGEVGVDEHPGGGSVFWFTVPLRESMS